jgi:hypothetical protein
MHPTKTGGSTVEFCLMRELKDSRVPSNYHALQPFNADGYDENHDQKTPILFGNYKSADHLTGGFSLQHASLPTARRLLGDAVVDAARKVAIVRDPYARVVSQFFYYGFSKSQSFPSFVVDTLPNWERSSATYAVNFASRQAFYTHENGSVAVDLIMRLENLAAGFSDLSSLLGQTIPFDPTFRVRMSKASSTFAHYMDAYDDDARAVVRRLYAVDFELLGYAP